MSGSQKVVIITGCSEGGIGFALSEEYAREGCKVYATARRLESMDSLVHANIERLTLDVTSDEQVKEVVQAIIEKEGRIDILVNNAGVGCLGPTADISLERVMSVFDANFFSVIRTFQAIFPHMAARKRGTVVNIGSVSGEIPLPWSGAYAPSKAALHRLSDVLYQECKPFNINVVCVMPGGIKSHISDSILKSGITLPEHSFYKPWYQAIYNRALISQGPGSLPAPEMAKMVVARSLSSSPPRQMTMGLASFTFRILAWLPKTLVLNLLWKRFSSTSKV